MKYNAINSNNYIAITLILIDSGYSITKRNSL